MDKIVAQVKQCSKCREIKPIDEFYKYKKPKDGLQYYCKQCSRIHVKETQQAHPGRYRNEEREYRASNRTMIAKKDKLRSLSRVDAHNKTRDKIIAALGSKCVRCGFDDPRALQVDHINGGGTQEHKELGIWGVMKKVLYHVEIGNVDEYYQLLCANCNWIKRSENRECRK